MGLRPDIPCKKHKNGSIELYATIAKTKRGCAYFDTPSIEYEDILSDKQRGAHPSPPKGREPDTHPQPLPKGGGKGQAPTRSGGYAIRLNKRSQVSGARYPPSLGEGLGVGTDSGG